MKPTKLEKFGRATKDKLAKAVQAVNHPTIRAMSKLGQTTLNTLFLLKKDNPLSLLSAGMSVLNSAAEAFELPKMDGIQSYALQHKLVPGDGILGKLVYTSDLSNKLIENVVVDAEKACLIELIIPNKDPLDTETQNRLYLIRNETVNNVGFGESENEKISTEFFVSRGFDFEHLFSVLWEQYAGGIFLTRHRRTYAFEIKKLNVKDGFYISEYNLEDFVQRLRRFLNAGIPRSYLLYGEPGAGKTQFALKAAKMMFKRIVKLDPSLIGSLETGELEFFISQMKPEVLIFDDFDRIFGGIKSSLFLLENLKECFPHIPIFGTANHLESIDPAILRPGRFDEILEFKAPEEPIRRRILEQYLAQVGAVLKPETVEYIIQKSEGMTPAFLKEIANRCMVLDEHEVSKMMDELNFYLAPSEKDDEDEEEDDE